MASPLSEILSATMLSSACSARPSRHWQPSEAPTEWRTPGSAAPALVPVASSSQRRSKIWQLAESLHCSIVGTCLSSAELRHVLVRLGVQGLETADEHIVHVMGVKLAGGQDTASKLLQKALDRRHELAVKHYSKAKDADALSALWDNSVKLGNIPGPYWALLTHPAATDAIVKKAFGHVHMLSHMVGAANRADIRRLCHLEHENAELRVKLDRQQHQLHMGFTARDQEIRRLIELLTVQSRLTTTDEPEPCASQQEDSTETVLRHLNRRLASEIARRERLEERLAATTTALSTIESDLLRVERARDDLQREYDSLAYQIDELIEPDLEGRQGGYDLSGTMILYVGGRANQVPKLKAIVERAHGKFLHHDGGVEHNGSLLPGLVSRADVVCFPVDCISHHAAAVIKRQCQQMNKSYRPLRTASVACLLSEFSSLNAGQATVAEA